MRKTINDTHYELERTNRKLKSLVDTGIRINVILVVGFLILIITGGMVVVRLGKLLPTEPEPPTFSEGVIQRLGSLNIMVGGVVYNNVCSNDLKLLQVGDYVVVEKESRDWLSSCGTYRVTVQKTTKKQLFNHTCKTKIK